MTSTIKKDLEQVEQQFSVDLRHRAWLEAQLFGKPSRRWWPRFVLTSSVALAALVLMIMTLPTPEKKFLTIQEVLAAVGAQTDSLHEGQVLIIRQIITSPQMEDQIVSELWTDGTRYLHRRESPDGVSSLWTEKNSDEKTMTEYVWFGPTPTVQEGIWDPGFIRRELIGNPQNGLDCSGCQTTDEKNPLTPDMRFFGFGGETIAASSAVELPVPFALMGSVTTIDTQTIDGIDYYHLVATGGQRIACNVVGEAVREFWIRQDTLQLTKRTWSADCDHSDEGKGITKATGEFLYEYRTVDAPELDHPFTLEWWLDSVDPEGTAIVHCSAFGFACSHATEKTEYHPRAFVLPDGWLNDPRLGSRKQIDSPDLPDTE